MSFGASYGVTHQQPEGPQPFGWGDSNSSSPVFVGRGQGATRGL
jgi:hypothetical protein